MTDHQTPRPVVSPSPKTEKNLGEGDEPITGSYLIPATVKDLKNLRAEVDKGLKVNELKTVTGIVVVALGIIFGAWRVVLGEARAQTDAGMAPIEKRVVVLEQNQAAVMTEVRELRLDLREAYKAQRYDRPSARLEQPPPPLLPADGGR